MEYRTLGKTGERVSAIGLGGAHAARPKDPAETTRIIHAAIDGGITFLDNCWDYSMGAAEERMGAALADGNHREKIFLMTKIDGHTREAATAQIDQCLTRLRTDHIDLMQIHEVIRADDPERVFAPGGTMEALLAAKQAGKIRYIGFTGHKNPDIHLKMLAQDFAWDTVQMPLNCVDAHYASFEHKVLPVLVERGIGVLGMKPMAAGKAITSGAATGPECLRYALSLRTSVVITGCDSMEILQQALDAGNSYTPMTPAEMTALLGRTAAFAGAEGQLEGYKTTTSFDGTTTNPHWLTTGSVHAQ